MVHDYTKLSAGDVLKDGRHIDKCPICGRSGIVRDDPEAVRTIHFEYEQPATAGEEPRSEQPRKSAICFRKKQPLV